MLIPDQSGVAQGINQGSSALASALQQAMAYRIQESQRKNLASQFGPDTVMGKILRQQGGYTAAKDLGAFLAPAIKMDEANRYSQNIDDQYTPVKSTQGQQVATQGQEQPQGVLEGVVGTQQQPQIQGMIQGQGQPQIGQAQPQEPQKTPIQAVKAAEAQSKQLDDATIEDSDYVTTKSGDILKKSDFIQTPIGPIHPEHLNKLANSPIQSDRDKAKIYNDHIVKQESTKLKEGAQVRQEWRKEIESEHKDVRNIDKSYSDIKRLESVKNMVKNSKNVNLDDNWVKNIFVAIASDSSKDNIANLFRTDEEKIMSGIIYDFLRPKELGGSNPSTKEVLLSKAAKASSLSGKKANISLLNDMLMQAHSNYEKGKIIANKTNNLGITSPGKFRLEVHEKLTPIMEKIRNEFKFEENIEVAKQAVKGRNPGMGKKFMVDKKGNTYKVPERDIKKRQAEKWVLLNGK